MQNEDLDKTAFVTIVDENIVNQNALKICICSFLEYIIDNPYNIIVLYPVDKAKYELLAWLDNNEIMSFGSKLNILDRSDPYYVKFLLSNFIIDMGNKYDRIFYIDPDHIFIKTPNMDAEPNSLIIGSEVTKLDERLLDHLKEKHFLDSSFMKHYNTSIIYGHIKTWEKAIAMWEQLYSEIQRITSQRYREEIAFTLAALQNDVLIRPADTLFQSSFHSFSKECSLFHYGGEYPESGRIKNCLKHDNVLNALERLMDGRIGGTELWVIDKLITLSKGTN